MKRTVATLFTSIAAILFLGACEQHSWDDTKHLFESHGGGDHAEDGDHAEGEGETHAKDDAHEKKAAH